MELSPTDVGIGAMGMFVINGLLKLLYTKMNGKNEAKIVSILERQTDILADIKDVNIKNGDKLELIHTNIKVAMDRQVTLKDIQGFKA